MFSVFGSTPDISGMANDMMIYGDINGRFVLEHGCSPNWVLVGRFSCKQDVNRAMDIFLKENNITRKPYERRWVEDGVEFVDYGSWSNFFRIREE